MKYETDLPAQSRRRKGASIFVAMCLALLLPGSLFAQSGGDYDLSWSTIDGGGGMWSTGGTYSFGGTIGQPDAGKMSGGAYALAGGFWTEGLLIEQFLLGLIQGWNLVSIPLEPFDAASNTIFPPANILAVWEYNNPGGYAVPAEVHPKKGYWVKASSAADLTVKGIRPSDTSVSLGTNWNLVGVVGPNASQPWQPVPVAPEILAIWEYLPPYQVPTQCNEGRGFWIKASQDATIW